MHWKNILAGFSLCGALAVGAAVPTVRADTFDATVVAGHPQAFLWVKHLHDTLIPTVNKALEGSGHTITWSEQYGGALAKVGGELDAIEEGLADLGPVLAVFKGTKLSLMNITYFSPFGTRDPRQTVEIMERMHQSIPGVNEVWRTFNAEYLGGGFAYDDYQILTTFPVKSLEDLKGRKIGTPGAAINWLKETGAVGVAADLTSYYNSIKTGVFEGAITFGTAANTAKLYEVAPHVTRVSFGAQYAGGIVANRAWFNGLPEKVQQALRQGADAYSKAYLAELASRTDAAYKAMADNGAKIADLPEAERRKWAATLPNIAKTWADELDGKGQPASELLKGYMKSLRDAGVTPMRDWDRE